MAGSFELFTDAESQVRFTLVAQDGTVLAVSGPYPDKRDAAAAIKDVRECAGTGLIRDFCAAPQTVRAGGHPVGDPVVRHPSAAVGNAASA
ncbi:YegP family protein [Pseudarthrobacter sp. AB1]|uniref:YegP family protein n=1 Tax=Pseudarthrobacter sp. AB1 TaxID=2138309 RepID=UPI00186B92E7|nr:YegP family protein [Pseudarthrobacter sp. AB1]MBE4720034.1 DUF1508 domain-containing protein [Pseudarthrobacter sp. AB1]